MSWVAGGLVALRTVEDYFIICTMGMGVILFSVMNNWMELTRGPLGIPGIPPVAFFGHELTAKKQICKIGEVARRRRPPTLARIFHKF
ncbi:MAG: hypothetical protein HY360_16195 [Verrucomicrobia bacterium]|nr:hypothetical protein [Verrucomicrobiota bacterium]